MMRLTILLGVLALSACDGDAPSPPREGERPMRIVSLDYCADQYVLKLADRDQILALSPDARAEFSYMRDAAAGLSSVRPVAEDVLILKPDLVVRSHGGGANAAAFFERAGVPVLQMGWASTLDGEGAGSIPAIIRQMGEGLGQPARADALIASYRARLAAVTRRDGEPTALYMTQAGVTTGPGSLIHEMLLAAGLSNYEQRPGWRSLPLERLVYEQPDVVAAAFFESRAPSPDAWGASNHPVARAQLEGQHVVPLRGAWTACGGWFILDAIEALALPPPVAEPRP